jgi:hypothetical protein
MSNHRAVIAHHEGATIRASNLPEPAEERPDHCALSCAAMPTAL